MTYAITLIRLRKIKIIVRDCLPGVKLLKYYVYHPFDIHLHSSKQRSQEYLMPKSVLKGLIMIYNGKKWAPTGLKKPHTQNRDLGNI